MAITNRQLAAIFADIAARLQIQGEVVFKTRAYSAVAETILNYPRPLVELWQEGRLHEVPGVGKEIAKKIDELMRTGRLEFYERLRREVPDGVAEMLHVPNMGPQRVKAVWQQLNVTGIDELEAAARAGKLRDLPKFGAKTEEKILAGIASFKRRATGRMRLGDAMPIALELIAALRQVHGVRQIECAGSLRRCRETIGDLDILVATTNPGPLMQTFCRLPWVEAVLATGETKTSVRLDNGLQADLRAVEPQHWGAALQYFTGSQAHNIRLRELAQRRGWSLNEYGLRPIPGEQTKSGVGERCFDNEADLYGALGLPYIPPELREDRGEIEAALAGALPRLIALDDLQGDLQMHTTWSDGAADVMTMARAALARGYRYILITDHTQSLAVANGLTPERVRRQRQEIDQVNAQLGGRLRVLHGVEVEVKADGSLDLPDDVLAELDIVQASLHTGLSQPRDQLTARALAAIRHPQVDILGHPSGRLINEREGGDLDWDLLFREAARRRVALEINADPARLDLNDVLARRAVELGCVLSISTDAHAPEQLGNMLYGVGVARRAWVSPDGVINTWPLDKLLSWAGARR
ncbi:MAG: DNA polymerase/3'-5' exonuclease PolX [Anaerolineae bacterium]|nr:DNA polymerase/3'-5' exonuclease PolX [Thermoflexales bacterium]MDW8407753.1 DNA polymerase/3'-5' exonuclease PolX [Anaerolineae bacterium]